MRQNYPPAFRNSLMFINIGLIRYTVHDSAGAIGLIQAIVYMNKIFV
jgi:hypothetical protein